MPTSVENYIFGELPRRLVVDPTANTGTSLTAGWVIVATGLGFQAVPVDPATLGFEPTLTPATGDPTTQYYRGDKTWQTLDAAAVGAIASSEKGTALGVATLDADGYVLLSQMNPSVVERVVIVADEAARYALTTLDVQNGDVVNQQSPLPATMWFVVDQDNLDSSAGYLPFSAGVAASVAWSGITGKPAIIGDLENISIAAEGDLIQFVAGNWVNVDLASLKADLALEINDIDLLQDNLDGKQDQSNVLDALTTFSNQPSSTGILVRNDGGLILGREVIGTNGIDVAEGKGNADNISLSLSEVGTAGTYGDDDNYPTYEVDAYGRVTSTTIKSLVKDTLTLLDQVADQTLVPNTTYQIGEYVETLSLLVPDPVVGGTKITLEVPPILGTPVGDINVSFPSGKELFGFVPSLSLKSMMNPLPGDRITFTYIDNLSQWVVYKAPGLYLRELYLVGDSTVNPTLEPSFFHSVASKATDSRVLSIPDRDVDLSSVGQTEFTSSEFSVVDPTDPSKKVAFSVGSVGAGNTSIITVPDSPVDLDKVAQAASTSVDGYLTATDWNTFNNKQNALSDTITVGTYGSDTQYPIITFNAKGIATGVTLQTVSAGDTVLYPASGSNTVLAANTNYTVFVVADCALDCELLTGYVRLVNLVAATVSVLFSFQAGTNQYNEEGFNANTVALAGFGTAISTRNPALPTQRRVARPQNALLGDIRWYPAMGFPEYYNWTGIPLTVTRNLILPNKDINFGDLPSVATTNNNALSGTRTFCLMGGGGSLSLGNSIQGTDTGAIGSTGCDMRGTRNVAYSSTRVGTDDTATDNSFYNCSSAQPVELVTTIGVRYENCTYAQLRNTVTWPNYSRVVGSGDSNAISTVVYTRLKAINLNSTPQAMTTVGTSGNTEVVAGGGTYTTTLHDIVVIFTDLNSSGDPKSIFQRRVAVDAAGGIISDTSPVPDIVVGTTVYTLSISVVSDKLRLTVQSNISSASACNAEVISRYF